MAEGQAGVSFGQPGLGVPEVRPLDIIGTDRGGGSLELEYILHRGPGLGQVAATL